MEIELPEGASMAEFQRYVHELEEKHGWLDVDLVHNGFLMTEEVGELFKAIRRYEGYFDASVEREAARRTRPRKSSTFSTISWPSPTAWASTSRRPSARRIARTRRGPGSTADRLDVGGEARHNP